MMPKSIQRALFSADLEPVRETLLPLVSILEAQPDWYGSVYFERKATKSWSVNLKQSQVSDQVSAGVVLRIYDGYTLFEQATDILDSENLKQLARQFAQRVAQTRPPEGTQKRPYRATSWKDRMSLPLDEEIRSQIPAGVDAKTRVHFGIRFREDPRELGPSEQLNRLKAILGRCQAIGLEEGLSPSNLSYIATRQAFSEEESIFVDRETQMSQTLYRLMLSLVLMSGSDRVNQRFGGLGGMETCQVKDEEIREMIRDLKGLKSAERLKPGRYRVIFGPALTGVLAHEAFGHSQEADTCARGRSKAWELHHSGSVVGNEHATILNNPALFENGAETYAAWGSYFFDEEGWLAQEQVILDQGKLRAPMTNLTSALRLGIPRTANGKRESWSNGVYTRQTNTYFSAGTQTLDELMRQMGDGFIAHHAAGGMEDPKGMGIQVGISFLQEVKEGKLTGRLFKGPAGGDIQLTGYTPDVLHSIIGKSKIDATSTAPDRGRHPTNDVGGCGKYHKEFVYAGCGGPHLLLDQVILG